MTFLGFRPRDDQSASLGDESRTWFEILKALEAYPGADDPSVISRTTPYSAAAFPNGSLAIAAHYRNHVENRPGGLHRDAPKDDEILAANPLPPDRLQLDSLRISGRSVGYTGTLLVAFRQDSGGRLAAFAGYDCDRIRIDDREHRFADRPLGFIAWAPVHPDRRVAGGALLEIWVNGQAEVRIPVAESPQETGLFAAGIRPGSRQDTRITSRRSGGFLEFTAGPSAQGHLFLVG